jgi:3-dehydroquinate dehydratase/shikimate dehydrogenase
VEDLRRRIARHPGGRLHEIRLDHLEEDLPGPGALDVDPARLLVACRPRREGGNFEGDEERRIEVLEPFIRSGVAWIDIEVSTDASLRERITGLARKHGVKVLASRHAEGPVEAAFSRLTAADADAVKLAVPVEDAADLDPLRRAGARAGRPAVLVGTGEAGLLSRALYPRFGGFMTYAASRPGDATAPGQLSAEEFERYRLPPGPQTGLYVLLGGSQVMTSPGPRVYNRLFKERGIDACYLPVITGRPAESLELLRSLDLKGASVTMPLKRKAALLMDRLSAGARETGAVNTISVNPDGSLQGDLTDGQGALAALQKAGGELAGKRAVILGSGATASAIARSLTAAGMRVTVLGRDRLKDLAGLPFDVLVQATPVGSEDPRATLVDDPGLLRGKLVLDVTLGGQTRLLEDAKKSGGVAVSGRSMWAEQGRLQLLRWLDLDVPAEDLEGRI